MPTTIKSQKSNYQEMIALYLASEFCHFEAGIQFNPSSFQRNFYMKLEDFKSFRAEHSKHGLFTTAYRYNKPDIRDADMIGNLYIDFDVNDISNEFHQVREDAIRTISALKAIFGVERESIQIYFSGNKGIHLIVPAEVLGIQPHNELNEVFKLVAEDMKKLVKNGTVDTRIYDKVRLFRVPNSIHPKTRLYKVGITFEELRDLDFQEVRRLALAPRKPIPVKKQYSTQANRLYTSYVKEWAQEKERMKNRKNTSKGSKLGFMPPCIQHILEEGAVEGKRNNTAALLASYFMQRGVNEDEAFARIIEWNETHCSPKLPERELEKTVGSIYKAEHRYGCRTLKELSICSSSCKFYKEE
jgi:hypothetical protein